MYRDDEICSERFFATLLAIRADCSALPSWTETSTMNVLLGLVAVTLLASSSVVMSRPSSLMTGFSTASVFTSCG